MTVKAWSAGEIRVLARQTVNGRKQIATARGAYFRALLETTQAELDGNADQPSQLAALKAVHRRFYPVVQEATTTADIAHSPKLSKEDRKRRALERNRRTNFARSAYGTIRRWLRAPDHDLRKVDAAKATKSQLLNEAPPTRKHALTPERIQARAGKLIDGLLGFTRQVAKADRAQADSVVQVAITRLAASLGEVLKPTTDAHVAAQENRPLRVGRTLFVPAEISQRRAI